MADTVHKQADKLTMVDLVWLGPDGGPHRIVAIQSMHNGNVFHVSLQHVKTGERASMALNADSQVEVSVS